VLNALINTGDADFRVGNAQHSGLAVVNFRVVVFIVVVGFLVVVLVVVVLVVVVLVVVLVVGLTVITWESVGNLTGVMVVTGELNTNRAISLS
jgi:hypothetical protein